MTPAQFFSRRRLQISANVSPSGGARSCRPANVRGPCPMTGVTPLCRGPGRAGVFLGLPAVNTLVYRYQETPAHAIKLSSLLLNRL
jgi:hypothetical protein